MERIFEEILPRAKKWSLFLSVIAIFGLLSSVGALVKGDFSVIIGLIIQGFFIFFLISYHIACKKAIEEESEEALEEACRHQKNIFMMYGIQVIMLLLFMVIGIIAAIVIR